MNVQRIGLASRPAFRDVQEVKRAEAEPVKMPDAPVNNTPKKRYEYNWKVISAVAAGGALLLLGLANRKSISSLLKKKIVTNNVTSGNANISTPKPKKPYIAPKITIKEKEPDFINPKDIQVSYEPERLFGIKSKQKTQPPKTIYINSDGTISQPKRPNGMFYRDDVHAGRRTRDYGSAFGTGARDTLDRAADVVILDDIINGGKEVRSVFDRMTEPHHGGVNITQEEAVANGVADNIGESVSGGGIFDNLSEHTSGFFDSVGETFDSFADGLSDFASSVGESLSDIV